MLSGFDVYKTYLALKRHFNSSRYNYFNYSFKNRGVSAKYSTYEERKDKWIFEKLAKELKKHNELEGFFIANFLVNPSMWVGNMCDDESSRIFNNWKRRTESLTYQFTQDVEYLYSLIDDFNNRGLGLHLGFDRIFTVEEGQHPVLLEQVLGKHVSLESVIIMNKILNFIGEWNAKILDQVVWPDYFNLLVNYEPFLEIDNIKKYRQIMKNKLDMG